MMHHLDTAAVDRIEERFVRYVAQLAADSRSKDFDPSYYLKHQRRFRRLIEMVPLFEPCHTAIEFGATDFLQVELPEILKCERMVGTIFSTHVWEKRYERSFDVLGRSRRNLVMSVDLESDSLAFEDGAVDFILCSEVIEHLDIDPMFMLGEMNRVLRLGGYALFSTPNSCSARNFHKIALGYRPHFFMQYERSRSPYRHNIEYDRHALTTLMRSAGLEVVECRTDDVFEPRDEEGLAMLARLGMPLHDRGDCIFLLARKVGAVIERWPDEIYV